jgi:RNA polymerase sigma-70 factor (ECF subfamily)
MEKMGRPITSDNPENQWLEQALAGNEQAFNCLMNFYQPRVRRLALRFFKSNWDADDACQNIFLKVYLHLPQFQQRSSFSSWLYRLAYNECLDEIRRRHQTEARDHHFYEQEQEGPEPANPQEQAESERLREKIFTLLHSLPPSLQDALVTVDYKDLSLAQASVELKVNPPALRVRRHRAHRRLRHLLQESAEGFFPNPAHFWDRVIAAV